MHYTRSELLDMSDPCNALMSPGTLSIIETINNLKPDYRPRRCRGGARRYLFMKKSRLPDNPLSVHDFYGSQFHEDRVAFQPIQIVITYRQPTSLQHSACTRDFSNLIPITCKPMKSSGVFSASIGVLNVRSVRKKVDDILDRVHEHDLDMLVLTETWLSNSDKDNWIANSLTPTGFKFFNLARSKALVGGLVYSTRNLSKYHLNMMHTK